MHNHPHIVNLLGICWDLSLEGRAWLVLVFEKAEFGNLKEFARLEVGKNLCFEDKLKLCTDIAVAVEDMHAASQ